MIAQAVWNGPAHAAGDGGVLRISPAAANSHNAIADLIPFSLWPHFHDLTGYLQPRHNRIAEVRTNTIKALTLQNVRAVDAGGANAHQKIIGPDLGHRLFEHKILVIKSDKLEYSRL